MNFDAVLDEVKSEIAMYECGDLKKGVLIQSLRRLIKELGKRDNDGLTTEKVWDAMDCLVTRGSDEIL